MTSPKLSEILTPESVTVVREPNRHPDSVTIIDPTPEGVTNRPRDAALIALSGTIKAAPKTDGPRTWLMLGVLLGILLCLTISLIRETMRGADVRVGPTAPANTTEAPR